MIKDVQDYEPVIFMIDNTSYSSNYEVIIWLNFPEAILFEENKAREYVKRL
jgi:hypothetical protein